MIFHTDNVLPILHATLNATPQERSPQAEFITSWVYSVYQTCHVAMYSMTTSLHTFLPLSNLGQGQAQLLSVYLPGPCRPGADRVGK